MRKGITIVLMLLALATAAPVSAREAQVDQVSVIGKLARVVGQVKRIFSHRIGTTGDHLAPPWPGGPTQPAPRGK